jgi:hypothetical protein
VVEIAVSGFYRLRRCRSAVARSADRSETDTKTLESVPIAGDMVDDALRNRLDGVLLLKMMSVSLLAGLVFGRDYGGEAFYALESSPVLVVLVLLLGFARS